MTIRRNDIDNLTKYNLSFNNTWQVIDHFEKLIAEFNNAPFAIATDSCTHAIELAVRATGIPSTVVKIPRYTYMSIPMVFEKLNISYTLEDIRWENYYKLTPYNIIDAAVVWQKNSYVPGSIMCLSFNFKKHLPIGRGGMILVDDFSLYTKLQRMVRDGRDPKLIQFEDDIFEVGYHYYMTPEDAARGIDLFYQLKDQPQKLKSTLCPQNWEGYKNLLDFSLFKNKFK